MAESDLKGGAVAFGHRAMRITPSSLFSRPQQPAQFPERPRVDDIISRQPAPAGSPLPAQHRMGAGYIMGPDNLSLVSGCLSPED